MHQTSLYQADAATPFYFLEAPTLYDRDGFYGDADGDYPDNAVRFAVFSRAALAVARRVFRRRSFTATTGRAGWFPSTCAPFSPTTRPSWA